MAILGTGGILELSREWPEVMALRLDAINFSTSTVALSNDGYWTGDRMLFTSANGIPFDLNGDGYADCPEGHGIYRGSIYELGPARDFYTDPETNENGPHYRVTSIALPPDSVDYGTDPISLTISTAEFITGDRVYIASSAGLPFDLNGDGYADLPSGHGVYFGSTWNLSPVRQHVTSSDSNYYLVDNTSSFYGTTDDSGLVVTLDAYIAKDANDKVRFYDSAEAGATEYTMLKVKTGNLVISKYRSGADYKQVVIDATTEVTELELASETALEDLIDIPLDLGFYYYNRAQETGFATQFDAYGYMDQLDRMRLMTSATDAYNDNSAAAVALRSVDCGNFVISRYSTDSDYTSALNTAANAIKPLTLQNQSEKLSAVITPPSELTTYPNDPNNRGWLVQCDLQEWAFSIDAANLDMTAIGETFGENAKSLVRGAGSLTFLVDQRLVDGEQTSMTLLRLVTLTEKQAKSSAKFHIYKDRTPVSPQVGTTAYYGCDILLTNTRINVRADDIITGTADFVATGEVGLKFEP
jgi:hypothetical protein